MSPDLERLIGRAVSNKAFRDALLINPEETIKNSGLTLTDAEIAQVKATIESFKNTGAADQFDATFGTSSLASW